MECNNRLLSVYFERRKENPSRYLRNLASKLLVVDNFGPSQVLDDQVIDNFFSAFLITENKKMGL